MKGNFDMLWMRRSKYEDMNIIMEKRLHIAMQALVTEMEFEQVKNRESPLLERLKRELDSGDGYVEYDYSVTDEKGNSIIDWN